MSTRYFDKLRHSVCVIQIVLATVADRDTMALEHITHEVTEASAIVYLAFIA